MGSSAKIAKQQTTHETGAEIPAEAVLPQVIAELLKHQKGESGWDCSQWRSVIDQFYLIDEAVLVSAIEQQLDSNQLCEATDVARAWVQEIRQKPAQQTLIDQLLIEYKLSSHEGLALMVMAESLLRIPDAASQQALINAELCDADWQQHIKRHHSFIMRCASHALQYSASFERWCQPTQTTQLAPQKHDQEPLQNAFKHIAARLGEPVIRKAIMATIQVLGEQFITAQSIEEALEADSIQDSSQQGYDCCSFDILGEAALSEHQAEQYLAAYHKAIDQIQYHQNTFLKQQSLNPAGQQNASAKHSLSIKLSALHPRLQERQRSRIFDVTVDRVASLVTRAREANIAITVDAEESERLALSLDIFAAVLKRSAVNWGHFGLAVQAYSKRHIAILGWLNRLSAELNTAIPVRLVKGAYWDFEIKQAQQLGLKNYPVVTRKTRTDCQYLFAAQYLIQQTTARLTPQFATHNAQTISTIQLMSQQGRQSVEFQRLHGMGEAVYNAYRRWLNTSDYQPITIRKYAPIGSYRELLPYLIRRLVENSANSSFVHQLWDTSLSLDHVLHQPLAIDHGSKTCDNDQELIKPIDIYKPDRINSTGLHWDHRPDAVAALAKSHAESGKQWQISCHGLMQPEIINGISQQEYLTYKQSKNVDLSRLVALRSPANTDDKLGSMVLGTQDNCGQAMARLNQAWQQQLLELRHKHLGEIIQARVLALRTWADLIDSKRLQLLTLLNREAGKTLADGQDEIREAIDFCRYYAVQAENLLTTPVSLPGITGEDNELSYQPKGIWLCISPWNFPLAIFVGQVSAALAAGNMVLAKPARVTPIIAALATELAYQAGIHKDWLQLINVDAQLLHPHITHHSQLAGVAFTGSLTTAKLIAQQLAQRPQQIIPLVAETGGQNAMIVDSTALLEQVVKDVIRSAYSSAGQRCSACRILLLQNDIASPCLQLLKGSIECLNIADPSKLETDIGPMISKTAEGKIQEHIQQLLNSDIEIFQFPSQSANNLPDEGYYSPLYLADFGHHQFNQKDDTEKLSEHFNREIFGPVLHVISYHGEQLNDVINWLNRLNYGLTLAVHSRNLETIRFIETQANVGNVYINRDQVGAVVGSQPFGGVGLSGTGPKAGGPNYLRAFVWEKTVTRNTTAIGANTELMLDSKTKD